MLLLVAPLLARESTDVIVMKNGDHLTGEIKGMSQGVLYISMNYILGTSDVQWSKVDHIESTQLFLVKTEGGEVYTGTLSTAELEKGKPMTIEVVESSSKQTALERQTVVEMDQTSERFWQRFNGEINTGITYTKGNQSTQYNLSSEVSYPRERVAGDRVVQLDAVDQHGSYGHNPQPIERGGATPAALEQLVLRRRRRAAAKFRTGH